MARASTFSISMTPGELKLLRQRINSGPHESAKNVILDGLRILLRQDTTGSSAISKQFQRRLAAGYKATAKRDRKLTLEWDDLPQPWPEE